MLEPISSVVGYAYRAITRWLLSSRLGLLISFTDAFCDVGWACIRYVDREILHRLNVHEIITRG